MHKENGACTRGEFLSRLSLSYTSMATKADQLKWRQIRISAVSCTIFPRSQRMRILLHCARWPAAFTRNGRNNSGHLVLLVPLPTAQCRSVFLWVRGVRLRCAGPAFLINPGFWVRISNPGHNQWQCPAILLFCWKSDLEWPNWRKPLFLALILSWES